MGVIKTCISGCSKYIMFIDGSECVLEQIRDSLILAASWSLTLDMHGATVA